MKQLKKTLLTLVALIAVTTHAWAQTGENIFQYCYDCQRSPAYPKALTSATLSGFANPLVGYKGSGFSSGNTSDGPWKLEYMGIWSSTDNHGINSVSNYQSTYNCTDVPVFRLYQWNATANEYQHAAYGVVCCYAKVSNAVEHTALFVAQGGWGCVLTNSSHSSSMNITFDEDLTTGLTTLIAAAKPAASGTPVPLTWDAATPNTATLTNGMPAGNVTVSVEYYPQAEFAMSTGTTPVALAPTAIPDVPANTDDPIVTAGTVANIGTSEVKQGTLMYFVKQADGNTAPTAPTYDDNGWSENVPTADGLQEGKAYVWYYIEGAEPANIADRTDDNTRSDSDIKPLGTTGYVTLEAAPLWNAEFDLTNAPEEDKAPGVWSTDIPKGGVVKGTPVKVTYTGTKKIIGVKAEKIKVAEGHALTSAKLGEIVCSDGKAYAAADKDILPKGVKAEALVCYANGGHGLALALTDEGEMNWKTAQTSCAAHTPAFTGGTWKLASQGEWNNMINAAGGYSALRIGFSSVGGTDMQSDRYWSSSGYDDDRGWDYNFSVGEWDDDDKTWSWYVRACLAF